MSSPINSLDAEEPGAPSDSACKLEQLVQASSLGDDAISPSEKKEEAVEQALETHEVIELQAFTKRKEWIDEKIQFLESIPSIDVFAGVQELSKTHDQIAGLPTRSQLNDWVVEHDRIEKETEMFDSGDLKKLKKLTKAATQRNLSLEDTDLIEITLTTLFALDKLFHLLRARSEQLDLLSLRLTWEEHRAMAYSIQTELLADLRTFLTTRARWTPDVYTGDGISSSSNLANSCLKSQLVESLEGCSRSARFKLAEGLSRDVAQISSRITSLRHGSITAAGRALDKLIEDSRKPVPDPILDEQDRLEEKCAMASVGKFLMAIVMQWKIADEIFIETRKDYCALQSLIDDIDRALKQHPTRRSETTFSARVDTLKKRLFTRTNPALSASNFPLPTHTIFPDQSACNADLIRLLSTELNNARDLVSKADSSVKSYRAGCEAVELAENLRKELSELRLKLTSATQRFRDGFKADDGDGSPPDLAHPSCVDPLRSSAYLAMLPSLVEEVLQSEQLALQLSKRARLAVLRLDKPGVDNAYKQSFLEEIHSLEVQLNMVTRVRNDVSADVSSLRDVRRVWSVVNDVSRRLDSVTMELKDALMRNRWRQQIGGETAPLTPESPRPVLPADLATPDTVKVQLHVLQEQLTQDISLPLDLLHNSLPPSIYDFVSSRRLTVQSFMDDAQSMNALWQNVRRQTFVMECIREEAHVLENRIEDSKVQYDEHFHDMLHNVEREQAEVLAHSSDKGIDAKELVLAQDADSVQTDVKSFVEALPTRVPLISLCEAYMSRDTIVSRLAFDPATVDRVVRSDSNAYAMRLFGGIKVLTHKRSFNGFYRLARDVSKQLTKVHEDIRMISNQLEDQVRIFEELSDSPSDELVDILSSLSSMKVCLEAILKIESPRLGQCISAISKDISRMRGIPGVLDDISNFGVLSARTSALDEINLQSNRMFAKVDALKADVIQAEQAEIVRLSEKARKQNEAEEKQKELEESARRQREQDQATSPARENLEMDQEVVREQKKEDATKRTTQEANVPVEYVFGLHPPSRSTSIKETTDLLARIRSLQKRLNSIGLNSMARPSGASQCHSSNSFLPASEIAEAMSAQFASVDEDTAKLPASAQNAAAYAELRSLRFEVEASRSLLCRIQQLARLSSCVLLCDTAFSEFLEHIDSYPAQPHEEERSIAGPSALGMFSEEQMSERMSYTKGIVGDMSELFGPVADDPRAIVEHRRLKQTWEELMEMALEKISDRPSRPGSTIAFSSGRNSSASVNMPRAPDVKRNKYSNLSVSGRDGFLAPLMQQRRAVSSSSAGSSRQTQESFSGSRLSISRSHNSRSVSGPMSPPTTPIPFTSKTLYSSTFASRQRTTSVSSTTSAGASGNKPPAPVGVMRRRMSSALSEAPRVESPTMLTTLRGTWARTPRQSFSAFSRASTPEKGAQRKTKRYIANPQNKLDVALGDVINNLPVDINVEAVVDTWKDKSGKYWIGSSEPKLCFCRILRSQTVMVRVGGGWAELSRFIKDHFTDLFRLMPEPPPRPGSKERWISAATLRNDAADGSVSTRSPSSPESLGPSLPSFAISTPEGTPTQAQSPMGSPLTPLQFIRRADVEPSEVSLSSMALSAGLTSTPSKSSTPRVSASNTPSKTVWRP